MPKVLLFSVSIGAGHDLAAQAIREEIFCRYPDAEIQTVDTFNYINPVLDRVVKDSYMETIRFTPKVWGYLYDQAEQDSQRVDIKGIMNTLLSGKLEKLVTSFQPDVIVCSHAFPCGMLSTLKRKLNLNTPIIAVVTDFTIHPFWLNEQVDAYILPSEQLRFYLMNAGIPEEKIWPCGLPIRAQFANLPTQAGAREALGLQEKTTLLVMGGGLGLGSIEDIVQTVLRGPLELQVIVICGKNPKLLKKLEGLRSKTNSTSNLVLKGFTQEIAHFMCAADMIISKPGGLTTAEVLACGVPLFIVDPIPGQEARNSEFLQNLGVGIKTTRLWNLIPAIQQLLACPLRQQQIKEMATFLAKPHASADIVDRICEKYFSESS